MEVLDTILLDVDSCCYGFMSLQAGTIMILLFSVILPSIELLYRPSIAGIIGQFSEPFDNHQPFDNRPFDNRPFRDHPFNVHPFNDKPTPRGNRPTQRLPTFPPVLDFYKFQYAVAAVIVSACGLFGLFMRKPSFLLPFVIVNLVEIVLLWIAFILTLFMLLPRVNQYFQDKEALYGVTTGTTIQYNFFFWWILFGTIILGIAFSAMIWEFTSVVYRYYESESDGQSDQDSASGN